MSGKIPDVNRGIFTADRIDRVRPSVNRPGGLPCGIRQCGERANESHERDTHAGRVIDTLYIKDDQKKNSGRMKIFLLTLARVADTFTRVATHEIATHFPRRI